MAIHTSRLTPGLIWDLSKILMGNVAMGLAYAKWMVPHQIINGGVTSLSMVINGLSGWPLLYLTNGLAILLLLLCWVFLGRSVFFKSLLSSGLFMLFFSFFYSQPFDLTSHMAIDVSLACAAIAFGYYCCLSANASTAGLDAVALIIHKRHPRTQVAHTLRYLNFAVLALGWLVFGWRSVVIGVAFSYGYSWILNVLLNHHDRHHPKP
ncbi:MAG: YitT family protein [Neisseriaceae bacterium]|nr:YitT family protein [Neisseriaceae bacterium]